MAHDIELTAADGHRLTAAIAPPEGVPVGGVLIIQEIFGLNSHIREVCDQFAEAGFLAVAPAIFDRLGKNMTVEYPDVERGRELVGRLDPRQTILDCAAGVEHATRAGRVGVVGFCWGGAQAYRCAAELPVAAAVAYYGGGIHNMTDLTPACPLMLHYGDRDAHISMDQVAEVRAANPEAVVHIYQGVGHGFNCNERGDYDPEAACLAFGRTTEFLKRYLA